MIPTPAVGVVCLKGDEVLLIRRGTPPRQGEWSLPGGRIEPGERLADAGHDYGKFAITLMPFRATLREAGAEPHATEHVALRWCAPEELRGLSWAPADVPIVEEYLAQRRG